MGHRIATMLRVGIALATLQTILNGADAYSIGDVDPRALRGVWRLTSLDDEGLPFERNKQQRGRGFFPPQSTSPDPKTIWKLRGFLPMKEFTTYPKKKLSELGDGEGAAGEILGATPKKQPTEIFIKLKDDFTFEQCTALQFSDGADKDSSLEEELEMEVSKREKESFAWKGTWDFIDGKLILAADRPEKKPFSAYDDSDSASGGSGSNECDTILVGKVAVQQVESLVENPALPTQGEHVEGDGTQAKLPKKGTVDVHLSVPKGKIKTGKFMYPKTHPSFFEQPIIRPQQMGRFELRQILGEHNAKLVEEDELIELFRKDDLVGKRFYLSTFPLPKRRKKFEYWDRATNSYKTGEYEPTAAEKAEEALEQGKGMQVMAVELFANNTFSTIYGLGSSTVLRGKWSIIGEKRDQLWMMVYRFGFGRSVSGSTFSEGTSLTQNDEKAYWGKIKEVGGGENDSIGGEQSELSEKKIEIKGAVLVGWGLEPTTLGRFKMIEIDDVLEEDEEDEEDEEEYEEMSAEAVMENASSFDSIMGADETENEDDFDSFDTLGAFE